MIIMTSDQLLTDRVTFAAVLERDSDEIDRVSMVYADKATLPSGEVIPSMSCGGCGGGGGSCGGGGGGGCGASSSSLKLVSS